MIWIIKTVVILLSLFALSRVFLKYKNNKNGLLSTFIWSVFWLGVIGVSFFPGTVTFIANIVGIPLGTTLIVFICIPLLFFLIFRIYAALEQQNKNMTLLVREIAIRDAVKRKVEEETINFIKDEENIV